MHIGIIEDHQLVRDSFKKLLELHADWEVIIEACNVDQAILAVALEQPDIFIVDISLNESQTGLTFLTYLNENFPEIKSYPTPEGKVKVPAGWLIESLGWKGKRVGNTGSHAKQALVLVNYGEANGQEVYELATAIQKSVQDTYQITLEMEVNVITE